MPRGGKRVGAGRRKVSIFTEQATIYLTPDGKKKLDAIAKAQKVPKGQVVEDLLNTHEVTQMYIDTPDYTQLVQKTKNLNAAFSSTSKMLTELGMIKDWTVVGEIARGYSGYPHDYPCTPLTCDIKSPFSE